MKAIALITALLLIIPLAFSIPFAVLPDVGVNGTVRDAFGDPIEGALVDVLSPLDLSAITDGNGNYFIRDVPAGTYDIVASAQEKSFGLETKKLIDFDATDVVTVDFVLYTEGTECQQDCSKISDEIPVCHADCEGINGCNFYDETAKEACANPPRVTNAIESYNSTHKLLCCDGEPYKPKKATIKLPDDATHIVRITRIVFWRGKFVRMIVDMFK